MADFYASSRNGGATRLAPAADFDLHRGPYSGAVQEVSPTAGSLAGTLPDARTLREGGPTMLVVNPLDSTNAFDVKRADGTVLLNVPTGKSVELGLADGSTLAGVWYARLRTILAFVPFLTGGYVTVLVKNRSGELLTDYPVRVIIDTAAYVATGGMASDGSDIEWLDEDGAVVPHWIESGMNTASTVFWVQIPACVAHGWAQIRIAFGDVIVGNGGPDPDSVFLLHDDFPGSSLDGSKWPTVSGVTPVVSGGVLSWATASGYILSAWSDADSAIGYAVRALVTTPNPLGAGYEEAGFARTSGAMRAAVMRSGTGGFWKSHDGATTPDSSNAVVADTDYVTEVKVVRANRRLYLVDDVQGAEEIADYSGETFGAQIRTTAALTGVQWFLVRPTVMVEPTVQLIVDGQVDLRIARELYSFESVVRVIDPLNQSIPTGVVLVEGVLHGFGDTLREIDPIPRTEIV